MLAYLNDWGHLMETMVETGKDGWRLYRQLETVTDRWSLEPSGQGAFPAGPDGCCLHSARNCGPSTRDRSS